MGIDYISSRGYIGDCIGDYYMGVIMGDTRSLDYSSYSSYIGVYILLMPY